MTNVKNKIIKILFACAEDEMPGVCYLSAYLKKHGYQTDLIFDPKQFDRAYIRNKKLAHFFSSSIEKDNLEKIKKLKPDLIGFSCTTAHYQWALKLARKIKKRHPKTPIIFGGTHPTLTPELVIKENCVDIVCIGEGEDPLLELVKKLASNQSPNKIKNLWVKTKNNRIYRNPLRPLNQDIDSLPFVDKELFREYLPRHYFTHTYFFTSRGCPYNCSYCGNTQMKIIFKGLGKYVRRTSPKRAVEELQVLKNKYDAKYILFEDDVFAMDEKWLSEFIPLYKKEIGLNFTCFGHVKLLTSNMVKLLKQGGCDLLWFGLQSANEKIRKEVFYRYESNQEVVKATNLCHKHKIPFMIDQILNVPYDNENAMKEAVLLYAKVRPNIVNCYNLLYFPKAKINDIALEAGLITKKDITLINQGKSMIYQTGEWSKDRKDFYTEYALLISLTPLLPRHIAEKIVSSQKLIKFFSSLPLFLVPIVKIVVNFKAGRGFLPLAILKMEVYFTLKLIKSKIRKIFN